MTFALTLVISQFSMVTTASAASPQANAAKEKRRIELQKDWGSINYSPKDPNNIKGIMYVFTDLDCEYCTKLHHEIPRLNKLGVEVRVMAMPREGVGSSSYNTLVSVWCSKNPQQSFERAIEGASIRPQTCKNPVKEHFNLAKRWGISGTPTVVYEDGTIRVGYFPADQLAKEAIKRSASLQKETPVADKVDNAADKGKVDQGKGSQLPKTESSKAEAPATAKSEAPAIEKGASK
jgi:thioredoxin-related protein